MKTRAINLVRGYLPNIDSSNRRAKALQLPQRFAVVMSSSHPDKTEMYFDNDLFVSVLNVLSEIIAHDEMKLNMDNKGQEVLLSINGLRQHYARLDPENQEPFWNGEFIKEEKVVAYLDAECYVSIGGLAPYHDSYTLSTYLPECDQDLLQQQFTEHCQHLQISIEEIYTGISTPKTTW
ncbi:MAG: hypothetical protein ABI210_01390 [Abditibacteriaceae bacterium]